MLDAVALELAPELPELDVSLVVVVTVVTTPSTVVPSTVVLSTVLAASVSSANDVNATVSCITIPDIVFVIVCGYKNVFVSTLSGTVDSGLVVAATVLPGNVVTYVTVTSPPNALAGIAGPTPEAVNCVGRGRVDASGFKDGLEA